MTTGDELKAAVSARRDLGPAFEDAVVESFLDKMGQEIDRRVDERLAAAPKAGKAAAGGPNHAQRLALAIVSLSLGMVSTLVLTILGEGHMSALIPIWVAIFVLNAIFNGSKGRD
ncbi:hypothetical protein ACIBP6_26880 [Nonomuraea terrae]|uniref:hypothetical protein n=1 Tax=Nonomuraea terrae TaxID=2530383 RepID=UPI0037B73CC4